MIGAGAKPSKSKKRPKAGANCNNNNNGPIANGGNSPTSPEMEGAGGIRRKPSIKKNGNKKPIQPQSVESVASSLSPITSLESPHTVGSIGTTTDGGTPSPYDSSLYSNGGLSLNLMSGKQPPSYEDCIKGGSTLQNVHPLTLESYGGNGNYSALFHDQSPQIQLGQGLSLQPQQLTPPYSNQQSPPHSVSSPPNSYMGSPSPVKSRPSLPTSPTHMAALRAATHQKHGLPQGVGFEFPDLPLSGYNLQQQQQQQYYHYLTPPSQHSHNPEATPQHYLQAPDNFPTPSPESPGHWSSSSPHSTSDWSEGIHSPAYTTNNQHQKQAEAIYI